MQGHQHDKINVIEEMGKLTAAIKKLSKDLGEVVNQSDKRQEALGGQLKGKVFELAQLMFKGIEHGAIAADATGIITGVSIFPHPLVDTYAKEWRSLQDEAKLADICNQNVMSGQAGGKFNKAEFEDKNGVITIFDRIKGTMTFIWHGVIMPAVNWCIKTTIKLKDWIILKAKQMWQWFASFFRRSGNNVKALEAEKQEKIATKEAEKLPDIMLEPEVKLAA